MLAVKNWCLPWSGARGYKVDLLRRFYPLGLWRGSLTSWFHTCPFFWVLFYSPFLFPRRVESSVLLFFSQQIVSFVSSSAKYKNKHVSLTSIISNGGGRPRWDGQSTSYKQTHVVYQESFLNAFESFLYNGKDLTWRFLSLMDGKLTANPSGRTKVGRWGTKNYIESLF